MLSQLNITCPIGNASGVNCYTHDDLDDLVKSDCGFIVSKSATLHSRSGNSEPRFWCNDKISLNSMGLPNYGINYYTDWIKHNYNKKPTLLSIANVNNDETIQMIQKIYPMDYINYPEVNVSCPNIIGKPQLAYDFEALNTFLSTVMDGYSKPYGLKLPPFFDPIHIEMISSIIEKHNNIKYITCCNSIGNALVLENNAPVILPKNGLGGLGGEYLLPIGLSNVYQFKKRLQNLDVIGCGGISTKEHISQYMTVGSSLVQIGTALWQKGTGIFSDLK